MLLASQFCHKGYFRRKLKYNEHIDGWFNWTLNGRLQVNLRDPQEKDGWVTSINRWNC